MRIDVETGLLLLLCVSHLICSILALFQCNHIVSKSQRKSHLNFCGKRIILFNSSNKLIFHTVRNLHFLSKNSTLISRENCRHENVVVLDFSAVDNFDFTRKIVKKILGEKLVKMLWFWTF